MLLRLVHLLLQGLGTKDRVTISLQKIGLLTGSLYQDLRKTQQLINLNIQKVSELKVLAAYLDPVLCLAP
jgi:hypothetical protein